MPQVRKIKTRVPQMEIAARFMPDTVNAEARTVEMVFSTETPVRSYRWVGWDIEEFNEVLAMDEKSVRMSRLESGAPVLNAHQRYDVDNVIGVVGKAWLANSELRGLVRFSSREDVQPIFQDVKDGILRNVSIGYKVFKYEDVSESDDKIKTLRATDWEPCEVSLVPIGADPHAGTRSAAPADFKNECELEIRTFKEDSTMPPNEEGKQTAAPAAVVDVDAVKADAAKEAKRAEKQRAKEIREAGRSLKLGDEVAEGLIDGDKTADEARREMINLAASRSESTATRSANPTVQVTEDEGDKLRAGVSEAFMHRIYPTVSKLTDQGRQYQRVGLFGLAQHLVGRSGSFMSKEEIAKRALSTSDFPNILANVAHKTLRMAYDIEVRTFQPWTVKGNLSDYKPATRAQLGDFGDLQTVNEEGEYQFSKLSDGAESIQLVKKGLKVRLSEEMIINDDLHAFARIPQLLGNAASRAESNAVYKVLSDSAALADGIALFHSSHANKAGSGTTIANGISAARAAIRKQKTLDGNDYMGLVPKFLVVGPDKQTEAEQVLHGQILATQISNTNPFYNSLQPIVENRISGNQWYVMCGPEQIDTVEIAYLDGMEGPQIDMFPKLEDDCVIYKVKHVFGVKAIDFRGMYSNAGA